MRYYQIGELSKKANVSIRTIRYYDNQGLLKPSRINESGYRFYSENDFLKLQKILSLKYLGFSLQEIFTMTINDNYISLQESLLLQTKIIHQKIKHLNDVESSLKETTRLIEHNQNVNWTEVLRKIQFASMENDLREQYKNATNVDIRIRLHDQYSQNSLSWFQWLFSQYRLHSTDKILEVGSGNGKLWLNNQNEIKGQIIVSDISQGMIDDAKENLKGVRGISFECFDCLSIPYPDNSFDEVIANHMLFYVSDIDKALQEMKRVLKPGGLLYCSCYGEQHMKEINDLVSDYNPKITLSNIRLYEVFGLDNGPKILKKYFSEIKRLDYNDSLEVTNMDDIANYILSCHGNQSEYISKNYSSFKRFIDNKIKKGTSFHVTKEAGMFICKK